MIYAIAFDGVIAEEAAVGGPLRYLRGAREGLVALLEVGHEVVVWSNRSGPGATAEERKAMEDFLAPMLGRWGPLLRIASPEVDGVKPYANVYVDRRCERFNPTAGIGDGTGASWPALVAAGRRST